MTEQLAVGFDFDHTLGVDNGLETTAFYRFAAELGHELDPRDPVWATFIADELTRFRIGAIALDDAVEHVAVKLGAPAGRERGNTYREICYALVDDLVMPVEGARELIAALDERNIPNAILTNGWSPLQSRKIARALDYRGPVLVSDELGILKPDAAAFGKLVDALGVDRRSIWFVGDNPKTDILGAQGAGLRGVWFDWEHLSYPADAPTPDVRIEHLRDLLDVLRGPAVATQNNASQLDGHA